MSIPSTLYSRRRDLDVVRELVVVSLIFFHTARIFDDLSFYVKNEPSESAVTFVVVLAAFWGMPLMFSIAGFAIWHSLQKRKVVAFVRERIRRLLIPFIVGIFILVPPQIYFRLSTDPAYRESYTQFYPRFFDVTFNIDFPWFISASPTTGLFQPAHLWFLYNLLVYTLLLLPVFLYLRKPQGRLLVERIVSFSNRPWTVFLLALPIALLEVALGADMSGGWNQSVYIIFIVYGYLFAANARFRHTFCKNRKIGLVFAIMGSTIGLVALYVLVESSDTDPLQDYDLASMMLRFSKGFVGWFWVVAILGFLENACNSRQTAGTTGYSLSVSRESVASGGVLACVERYANEAVLPFYLLHQTVIVVTGFYVVQWNTGALPKFFIISLASLVVTLLLYEVMIRRIMLMRFLFGMKSGKE